MDQERRALLEIQRRPDNRKCFDCGTPHPQWADVYYGILVCFNCAAHHRLLGPRISRVLSLVADCWSKEDILSLRNGGNFKAFEYLGSAEELSRLSSIEKRYKSGSAYIYRLTLSAKCRGGYFANPSNRFLSLISNPNSILSTGAFGTVKDKGIAPEADELEGQTELSVSGSKKVSEIKDLFADLDSQDQDGLDPFAFIQKQFSGIGSKLLFSTHDNTPVTASHSRYPGSASPEVPCEAPLSKKDTDFISGLTSGVSLLKSSMFGAGQRGLQIASALVHSSGKSGRSSFLVSNEDDYAAAAKPTEINGTPSKLVIETPTDHESKGQAQDSRTLKGESKLSELGEAPKNMEGSSWGEENSWEFDWDEEHADRNISPARVLSSQSKAPGVAVKQQNYQENLGVNLEDLRLPVAPGRDSSSDHEVNGDTVEDFGHEHSPEPAISVGSGDYQLPNKVNEQGEPPLVAYSREIPPSAPELPHAISDPMTNNSLSPIPTKDDLGSGSAGGLMIDEHQQQAHNVDALADLNDTRSILPSFEDSCYSPQIITKGSLIPPVLHQHMEPAEPESEVFKEETPAMDSYSYVHLHTGPLYEVGDENVRHISEDVEEVGTSHGSKGALDKTLEPQDYKCGASPEKPPAPTHSEYLELGRDAGSSHTSSDEGDVLPKTSVERQSSAHDIGGICNFSANDEDKESGNKTLDLEIDGWGDI